MISELSQKTGSLQHLQIELTSRCNLVCKSCVRPSFHKQWQAEDLSYLAINRIIGSDLRYTSVHLQGWGESLLRNDLPEIITRFKKRQCLVSLSSNGKVMSSQLAGNIIEAGIDSMAFSLAGAERRKHDAVRGSGSFELTIKNIALFAAQRKNESHPPIAISYLLTPANLRDLPKMIRLCSRLGVKHLIGTHLVHICSSAQMQMAIYENTRKFIKSILLGNAIAPFFGVKLSLPPLKMREQPECAKSPTTRLFVASDGAISPCVLLCPPLLGNFKQLTGTSWQKRSRLIFGNLHENTLAEIWQNDAYRAFRKVFQKRNSMYTSHIKPVKSDFEGMEKLLNATEKVSQLLQKNRPPYVCQYCPRLFGM